MFGTVRCLVFSRETDLRNVTWIAFFSETQRCTHFKFCKQAYFKFFYKANGFKNESERVTLSSSPTLNYINYVRRTRFRHPSRVTRPKTFLKETTFLSAGTYDFRFSIAAPKSKIFEKFLPYRPPLR